MATRFSVPWMDRANSVRSSAAKVWARGLPPAGLPDWPFLKPPMPVGLRLKPPVLRSNGRRSCLASHEKRPVSPGGESGPVGGYSGTDEQSSAGGRSVQAAVAQLRPEEVEGVVQEREAVAEGGAVAGEGEARGLLVDGGGDQGVGVAGVHRVHADQDRGARGKEAAADAQGDHVQAGGA